MSFFVAYAIYRSTYLIKWLERAQRHMFNTFFLSDLTTKINFFFSLSAFFESALSVLKYANKYAEKNTHGKTKPSTKISEEKCDNCFVCMQMLRMMFFLFSVAVCVYVFWFVISAVNPIKSVVLDTDENRKWTFSERVLHLMCLLGSTFRPGKFPNSQLISVRSFNESLFN